MIGSAICSPTLRTGLSALMAPWNTMEASAHRTARSRPQLAWVRSSPWKRTLPSTRAPTGSNRSSESAIVDLPDPDSPATPSVWPASRSKSTPRTARTSAALVR